LSISSGWTQLAFGADLGDDVTVLGSPCGVAVTWEFMTRHVHTEVPISGMVEKSMEMQLFALFTAIE
jgi:hypothetical protein